MFVDDSGRRRRIARAVGGVVVGTVGVYVLVVAATFAGLPLVTEVAPPGVGTLARPTGGGAPDVGDDPVEAAPPPLVDPPGDGAPAAPDAPGVSGLSDAASGDDTRDDGDDTDGGGSDVTAVATTAPTGPSSSTTTTTPGRGNAATPSSTVPDRGGGPPADRPGGGPP